jgi:hypothetical protein
VQPVLRDQQVLQGLKVLLVLLEHLQDKAVQVQLDQLVLQVLQVKGLQVQQAKLVSHLLLML